MMLVETEIKPSSIHGFGVFAKHPIKKGTIIWEFHDGYDLKLSLDHIIKTLPQPAIDELLNFGYIDMSTGDFIMCLDKGRFMNHSDHPNTGNSLEGDAVVALQDIEAGEELTADYRHFDSEPDLYGKFGLRKADPSNPASNLIITEPIPLPEPAVKPLVRKPALKLGPIFQFIEEYFHHFNAYELRRACEGYLNLIEENGKVILTMAGAMSTARIGISLSKMIHKDLIHAVCCTGANLEEDIFSLLGYSQYHRIPNHREVLPAQDEALAAMGLNRVTDICIPESIMRGLEEALLKQWKWAHTEQISLFPHEHLIEAVQKYILTGRTDLKKEESWVLACAEKNIPIFVPGWEDSTLGNMFTSHCLKGEFKTSLVKNGVDYMMTLAQWYQTYSNQQAPVGFYQIGGGITGDFAISAVPMLRQDCHKNVPHWAYFCQISDSTTSYGSYSGAPPSEKISWDKICSQTPRFMIESDATIVVPLMFAAIMGE